MSPFKEEIIKQEIIDQLTWNDSVNANDIFVNVQDGHVELRGNVSNYTAKMAAERDAFQINGVSHVDNYLKVAFPPSVTLPDDSEIESNVESMLSWNTEIDASNIEVKVSNNIVKLSGEVNSYWEKFLAISLTNSIRGVVEVDSNLIVRPALEAKDSKIEEDIKNAFKRTYLIDEEDISVKVKDGVVHLRGSVPNYLIKIQAHNIAVYTSGVVDVVDELIIK